MHHCIRTKPFADWLAFSDAHTGCRTTNTSWLWTAKNTIKKTLNIIGSKVPFTDYTQHAWLTTLSWSPRVNGEDYTAHWPDAKIWPWSSMSPMSARPVFIGCGNWDVCGGHWTRSQRLHSFMPSLRPTLTTVTYCWLGHRRLCYKRLLNAAARLVSDTKKFDSGFTQLMHVDLHWLDVPEWVKYKLVSMVHNYLRQKAPQYLSDCCIPISHVASRRHLRSASRHQLVVPRHNLSTYGRRALSVAGPADSFRRVLKSRLFSEY